MVQRLPSARPRPLFWRRLPLGALLLLLLTLRQHGGLLLADTYAILTRPFWPGTAQSEWLKRAGTLEDYQRLVYLERENQRLKRLLNIRSSSPNLVTTPVIGRSPAIWWQQMILGSGGLDGVAKGDAVLGPGGLVGRVDSLTPTTARVRLVTDPGSRIGVWIPRIQRHGLLTGVGTNRPLVRFLNQDPGVVPGDLVVTSPASTLVPPGLPVGVVQDIPDHQTVPEAIVQLSAPIDAMEWAKVMVDQPGQG